MHRPLHIVILAAGRGSRFGSTKQLAELHGESLVARACRIARTACGDSVLLVAGHDAARVIESAGDVRSIVNQNYREGIGTSISAAAAQLSETAGALLILLADQVGLASSDLAALIRRSEECPGAIVASRYRGATGPPVVFPQSAFPMLRALRGDAGARQVIESGNYPVEYLDCAAAALDVDRPADLAAVAEGSSGAQ